MEKRTTFIDHDVVLHNDDLLELGEELGRLDSEEDDLTVRMKESTASFKAQLSQVESRRKACTKQLREKKKTVNSECEVENDFVNRSVDFRSIETGKIVLSRKMTDAEYSLPSIGAD